MHQWSPSLAGVVVQFLLDLRSFGIG